MKRTFGSTSLGLLLAGLLCLPAAADAEDLHRRPPLQRPGHRQHFRRARLPRHRHGGPARAGRAQRGRPHVPLRRRHGDLEQDRGGPQRGDAACRAGRPGQARGVRRTRPRRARAADPDPFPDALAAGWRGQGRADLGTLSTSPSAAKAERPARRSPRTPRSTCASGKGDYVGFNDEGGFVEPYYRSGVPYQVLGAVRGSALDSFLRGGGTNNGSFFKPSETSAMEGFATRSEHELMLQVELGTGADARYVCPSGTRDAPAVLPAVARQPSDRRHQPLTDRRRGDLLPPRDGLQGLGEADATDGRASCDGRERGVLAARQQDEPPADQGQPRGAEADPQSTTA